MSEDNPLARKPGRPPKIQEPDSNQEVVTVEEETITLTKSELASLKQLLAKTAEEKSERKDEEFAKTLADSLADALSRDRKTPAQKENDRMQKQQMVKQALQFSKSKEYSQRSCEHWAGGNPLSERHSDLRAIWWHEIHDHFWWGVCSVCQREFWPSDPDYAYWRKQKSFNKASRSDVEGSRGPIDINELTKDHRPFGSVTGARLAPVPVSIPEPQWVIDTF
jgi:hypothetical protein